MSMILIREAYNHLEGKEGQPIRYVKKSLYTKIERLIQRGIIKGDWVNKLVDLESLIEYFEFEASVTDNYMTFKEFQEKLEFTTSSSPVVFIRTFESCGAAFPFDYIETENRINDQTFFISKSSVERFLIDYISMDKVRSKLNRDDSGWWRSFKRLGITLLQLGKRRFIKNSEFKIILDDADAEINASDYYSLAEYRQILSATQVKVSLAIEKEYNLKPKKVNGRKKYYKKEAVDALKLRQNELREKYISLQEMKELATAKGVFIREGYIKSEPLDSLIRPFFKTKKRMYSKESFNNWLEERIRNTEFFAVSTDSDLNTFKNRLDIIGIDIEELGPFTSKTWLEFISSRLKRSKANSRTTDITINRYVYCTEDLMNLLSSKKRKEVYSLTSNDINTFFNEITKKDARIIYQYFKQVYNQLSVKQMKAFDINKVINPINFDREPEDKSIYEYEVYKELYNYVKDISLHKERAIKDALQEISTGKKPKYLASSWLYVLLHLNNAWRHSDVIRFPQVSLNGTKITDLSWMLDNELSDEDADYIINQVYRTEFVISKTQVKNYFFCSEELKIPLATAVAINQLRIDTLYPARESIVDFGNKKRNFSDARRKHFFKLYDDKEFHFSSRKMNRSLMSFIYVLLSKMKKGAVGLETIQKMRGHLGEETTNIYVDIPEEELNFLTRQLFARGSFGFIYDIFLDILQGVEIDREKRTTEVQFLEKYLGSIYKVEGISGFLNVIESDRKSIVDRILSMGLNETMEFLHKIETNQLPSKQDNIQCIVAESGCVKIGQGVSCYDCAFSIPNYYALSTLGASLQNRLDSYLDSQKAYSEKPYYEQRKRARLFYIQLEMFAQAYERFGNEVYEFITDSREDFIAKQTEIGSLEDQYQLTKGI